MLATGGNDTYMSIWGRSKPGEDMEKRNRIENTSNLGGMNYTDV